MTVPFGEPIVLRRRVKVGVDSFGNDVLSYVDSTVRGAFNPGSSVELVQGRDVLTVQPTVYLPPDVVLGALDAVLIGGQVYEVDGSPKRWVNPYTGWHAGVEVKLRRVTG